MLYRVTRPLSNFVERYLPDPYIFVLLLTIIVLALASIVTPLSPMQTVQVWGQGFWQLLSFAMQMLLILLAGYMLASAPLCIAALDKLAKQAKTPVIAIIMVTVVAMLASWINWGFGLVVGALFAKALAKHVLVDYRVLVASAYSGFIVWHGGLSGSVPLTIASEGHFSHSDIGIITTQSTLFSPFNLLILALLLLLLPLLNALLLPPKEQQVLIEKTKLTEQTGQISKSKGTLTPAQKLEHSKLLGVLVGLLGCTYLFHYFVFASGTLNLNSVITIFLFLAILLHQTPARLLASLHSAIAGGAGIVIQFPFYAGIMAVMVESGLAQQISSAFVSISNAETLPFWSFLSAGLVNIFVPSGGGQWAVQAPIVIPAAQMLDADIARVAMAVAWGDAWTNLVQPFWALPVLAIAGLKARDIMGFCLIQLIFSGIVIAAMLTWA
ncbi:Putative short-chain fatty acid transporter [Pseudoalteromonas holothuriae]|uniref:Short-chain fatty acid transporter n=1 Tax=Pseudoalteromonas holothuriae TaxID=2963714 RepID=A0A9W4VY64_9GAMM|nr:MULTISPECIES: TIGR00366 family protein [unclassified Pseudoalteromonas]CAH9063153.1 Putative short-chain fatty acid transporter [Pseudoalteromonas sp. CIP111854]CAH9065202.1 Putative short-chain fatty acid transporter [Pseudoalteromonas sp. CIP111951]